jgi:hypothetical protein
MNVIPGKLIVALVCLAPRPVRHKRHFFLLEMDINVPIYFDFQKLDPDSDITACRKHMNMFVELF